MENINKVNNSQINKVNNKNRYTLGLLATLCLLTSSFGIKAMEKTVIGVNIVNSEESQRLLEKLWDILRNKNDSPAENLKEFKETLAELEKIAGPSIGKIIDDNYLLHRAAEFGKIEAIKVLVEKGADINAENKHGGTALHKAAQEGQAEAIKVLLELGAKTEAKDAYVLTALHYAASRGCTEAIKVLLGYDADASDIFFIFDKYIPLVFEKCICGNRGNNTEKINYKINEALEKTKVKTNQYKRLYINLKNSLIVIQNLSGIRIKEDKRVGIQKISLDELGIIMSFTNMDFGGKIDARDLTAINKFERELDK